MKVLRCIKLASLSALSLAVMAGCDSFKKSGVSGSEGRVVSLADGRQVVVSGQKQSDSAAASSSGKKLTPPDASKQDKNSKSKKSKKDKNQPVTVDRQVVDTALAGADALPVSSVDSVGSVAVSAPEAKAADAFSLNGEWTIYSVRGNAVTGEERPYVTFDLSAKRFYGNNGCNYINGDVSLGDGDRVDFSNMISTMMMCQDDKYQYLINLALDDVVSYSARQVAHETFLDLKDSTGRVILVLRRHNMDFLNGAWKVVELNDTPLVQDDEATMTFDTTDLKIHGTTGCNIFNGELFIDPDKTASLQILRLATTRMGCPPESRETEFLLGLESVETAKSDGADQVVLYDVEGNQLFKLVKIELRDDSSAGE